MSAEPTRLYTTLIDRLSDVPGVLAAAAFDESGHCLSCFVGESFQALGAGRVIPMLQELAAPTDVAVPFDEGVTFVEHLLVRVLLRRSASSTFVVLIDPEADVDVVVAHLTRATQQIARAAIAAQASALAASAATAPVDADGPRTTSGFFARGEATPAAPDATPSPRAVEPLVVERLRAMAIEALGFAAEIVFDGARASVTNLAGQVPRARWVELVGKLASEIDDDDAREAFVARALLLPKRVRESDALDLLSPLARWVVERRAG